MQTILQKGGQIDQGSDIHMCGEIKSTVLPPHGVLSLYPPPHPPPGPTPQLSWKGSLVECGQTKVPPELWPGLVNVSWCYMVYLSRSDKDPYKDGQNVRLGLL